MSDDKSIATHGHKFIVQHPMPTREQRIAEIDRALAAGEPLGASHVPEIKPGIFVAGSLNGGFEYSKIAPSGKPRWPCRGIPVCGLCGGPLPCLTHSQYPRKPVRKSHNRNGSACHGKDVPCMPGLNGKCVACFDDD